MTDTEAEQILEWLTGCFGKRLEDNERMVWLSTLVDMDARRAMEIALQYGKTGERFPTTPEFRRAVRPPAHSDESWRDLPPESLAPPEWVSVWFWSVCTRDEHRPFPQFVPRPDDAMTDREYEIVRQEWEAKGSPRLTSVRDLMKAMV